MEVVKVTEEVAILKKRKSKAQEDSVEKPKKRRSAFQLYYFDVHQTMQKEIPNLQQSEIKKRISESWKKLSVAEKAYYLEKAKSEKEGIATSSLSPYKDLPGFRKILPRASYFLLSKGCSSNQQLAGAQSEVSLEALDSPVEGGLPSVPLPKEPQFTPLELDSEVQLSEQSIVVDNIAEETEVASNPTDPQGIPRCSSSSVSSKTSMDAHASQGSGGLTANEVPLKGNETRVAACGYGVPIQGEMTNVVSIVPTQNLLEAKSLPGVSSVGSVMMVSVGASTEQSAKPSYKMTYTRRGRGRCLNPGCSFVYVTRHKPPKCPDCGSHLGGKWIPTAKMTQEKRAVYLSAQNQELQADNKQIRKALGELKDTLAVRCDLVAELLSQQH